MTNLTPRERQIMAATVEGSTGPQIGAALGISTRTVENHRANAMEKLGAGTIARAAVIYDRQIRTKEEV